MWTLQPFRILPKADIGCLIFVGRFHRRKPMDQISTIFFILLVEKSYAFLHVNDQKNLGISTILFLIFKEQLHSDAFFRNL